MPRTPKESRYVGSFASPREYGWSKIAEVSVERAYDQTGMITDEWIDILTADGEWFQVTMLKTDAEAEALANVYRARGWTDSRCIYMGKAA